MENKVSTARFTGIYSGMGSSVVISTVCTARVAKNKCTAIHGTGQLEHEGDPVLRKQATDIHSVSISVEHGTIYLLRLNALGETVADTWHPTIADAKRQAHFEYEIENDQWQCP